MRSTGKWNPGTWHSPVRKVPRATVEGSSSCGRSSLTRRAPGLHGCRSCCHRRGLNRTFSHPAFKTRAQLGLSPIWGRSGWTEGRVCKGVWEGAGQQNPGVQKARERVRGGVSNAGDKSNPETVGGVGISQVVCSWSSRAPSAVWSTDQPWAERDPVPPGCWVLSAAGYSLGRLAFHSCSQGVHFPRVTGVSCQSRNARLLRAVAPNGKGMQKARRFCENQRHSDLRTVSGGGSSSLRCGQGSELVQTGFRGRSLFTSSPGAAVGKLSVPSL